MTPFQETSNNVFHDRKVVFVHIPKTAGTSIKKMLGSEAPGDHRVPHKLVHFRTWKAYFSFLFVRNPFEKLVSAYAYHTAPDYDGLFATRWPFLPTLSIEAYFDLISKKTEVLRPQVDFMRHAVSKQPVDEVYRYETLAADVARLQDRLGLEGEIPHLNPSSHEGYASYFTDAFRQKITAYYREDLEAFGYAFGDAPALAQSA